MASKSSDARRLRARLYVKQGGLCWWCGHPMNIATNQRDPLFATIEHRLPRWFVKRTKGNLVLAHARCNEGRPRFKFAHDPILWA